MKENEPDKRIFIARTTKWQSKGLDLVRLKTEISTTLMACLIDAWSTLSYDVIQCKCDSCSDRVRRLLVHQMSLIYFFDTSKGSVYDVGVEVVVREGSDTLSISTWRENQLHNVALLMQDPLGSLALTEHALRFPGTILKIKDYTKEAVLVTN